jgi:hydroxymethylpyrimidine kinase/phosphomethylpyrimidine kinase
VMPQPVCMTIAGLDPSGGAGVIADIKAFTAMDCYAAAVVTSLTFQNTTGVFGAAHQTGETVRRQAEAVFDDLEVAALKTGMLPTADVIGSVASIIRERKLRSVVVDPVVRSTSGYDLIDDPALRRLIEDFFPLADLITPNIAEAERIAGFSITDEEAIERAAVAMHSMGAKNVLIKGGHLGEGSGKRSATDHLFIEGEHHRFEGEYIDTRSTHGTGCTLAAAIAAGLARGDDLIASVGNAKRLVADAIRSAPGLGRGHSPINIPQSWPRRI